MRRERWLSVVALIVAFTLGGVAGAFGMRAHVFRGFADRMHGPPGRARMEFRLEAMSRELDLSQEQRDKVRKVFESHEQERRALFDRCAPEQRALTEKINAEVRALLSPEQQKKHDEMIRERRRDWPPAPSASVR
jgi:Spy/CpxP family protein refolding chaperone